MLEEVVGTEALGFPPVAPSCRDDAPIGDRELLDEAVLPAGRLQLRDHEVTAGVSLIRSEDPRCHPDPFAGP